MTRREVLDIISEYNIRANLALHFRRRVPERIHAKMMGLMGYGGYAEYTKHTADEIIVALTENGRALPYD